ncbi:RNA polymerase-associated protein rtf1, partial [Cladochytrium tenue]
DSGETDGEPALTLAQVASITVARNELAQWAYTRFFVDTVVGCFVRIGIGFDADKKPIYRLAQIVDIVDYHKPYYIESVLTKRAIQCLHGKARRVFTMDVASNHAVTE